jgi:hypothetical protein
MVSKNEQIVKDLINKMFEIAGHNVTYNDVINRKDDWYLHWTMTEEQNNEWLKWGKEYLKKKLKTSKYFIEKEMGWANMMWGLKIKN